MQNPGKHNMARIALQGIVLFTFLILGTQFAVAEDNQPVENANSTEISQDDSLKNCAFVTNNCELCSVEPDGKVSCSSVGIACEPTIWRCLNNNVGSDQ